MSWSPQPPALRPSQAPALPPRPRQTSVRVTVQRNVQGSQVSASPNLPPPSQSVPVPPSAPTRSDTLTQWREPHHRIGSTDSSIIGSSPPSSDADSVLGTSPFRAPPIVPFLVGARARAPSQSAGGGSLIEYDFDLASEVGSFTRTRPGLSLDLYSEAGTYAEREEDEDNFSDAFDSDSDDAITPAAAVPEHNATSRESSGIARAFGLTPPLLSSPETLGSRTPRANNMNNSLLQASPWADDDDAVWDAEFTSSPRESASKRMSRGATSSNVKLGVPSPSVPVTARRARASSRASAKQTGVEGLLPSPPPPTRDEVSRHSQAVSESWDEDFLFQNDDEDEETAESHLAPHDSTDGSPTDSALAAGGWERTRDQEIKEKEEEEEDESTWDTQTTPGVTASNSAATLLAGPRTARPSSPHRMPQPQVAEVHQRTPSRSSAHSEMTDLSARLAMQSDVSSWRSRFSSASSSNSRSRTPSLSGSRRHSRISGAHSSLGGDETEEEAELRTSDGGTELSSDIHVEDRGTASASGDETETESMLGSRTSSRRSSVLYAAVADPASARRLSTAKRPTSSRSTFERSTGSIRRKTHIEARTATPEEPLGDVEYRSNPSRNSLSSHVRLSPQMHAPALPMNVPQQHSRRDSNAGISVSPSNASLSGTSQGRHERTSSRNSFRDFLKRATSPRRKAAEREGSEATEPQESSSPRPSISRWRLSSKTDLPLEANAGSQAPVTETKRKGHTKGAGSLSSSFGITRPAWTHHRSSSRDVSAIQSQAAASSSSVNIAHTSRPLTPSGRPITPIVVGPAQSFAAAGDVLQRPQRDLMMPPPSPVRTSSLLPYQRTHSPDPPTPGRRRAHSPGGYESAPREESISPRTTKSPHAVGGIRRVPSKLDRSVALSNESRTVSASTTATGTSGTGTSDNWTGTSVGGGETEGTSIFGSSYDSTPPMISGSGIWARRMSSSSEASVRKTAASKAGARREPKLMLRQLPEGKAAEGLRSPDLHSSASSRNTSYTSTGAASSASADAPSVPPSRRGSSKNAPRVAPELRRSQTSQDALVPPSETKKAPRSARNSLSGSTGRRVARRNSLGDLRIPARISKAQDGIRANITHVRDFAKGVDELKELRKSYRSLLSGLQDEDHLDSPDGSSHVENLAVSPETAAEVAQIDASLAGWWEIADVLIGLGEGRGELDAEASLATLTHSPVAAARERCITLHTQPAPERRASTIPTPVSFSSAMAGDQQATVRRGLQSGSNSRASSNSRVLHPQRELDILAAMLAGAPPDQVSPAREYGTEHIEGSGNIGISQLRDASASVTSLTFDESGRPDRTSSPDAAAIAAERERKKLARLSLPYRTAPAGLISPFAGISTDSLYQPSTTETTKDGYRKRSANKAARGLQNLLELVRTLKNTPEPGAYGAGRTLGSTSQISLGRRFSRRDSSHAAPPPLPDRNEATSPSLSSATSPPSGTRRRSFMAKLRPDCDASTSTDQSPRRKRSTSRLFGRESVDLSRAPPLPSLPSFERTTHTGESARHRLPSTASHKSVNSAADTSTDSEWVQSSDFDSPGVRQSGDSSSGWSGVAGLPGGRRQRVLSFLGRARGNSVVGPKVVTPTTPTGGQSGLESSASESSPRLAKRSSSSQIAAESNASARPRVMSSTSYGRYANQTELQARAAAITRSASTSNSPSPSSAGQSQLGKPGQLRPSAGSTQTGTSDSDSGWARRAEDSNVPATPLLSGMTPEATFRKLAMSPDAISGLLVHVHAARQHCADGVAALRAVHAASVTTLPSAAVAQLALPTEPNKRAPSPLSPPRGSTLEVLTEGYSNESSSPFDMQATIRGSRDLSRSPPSGLRGWPGTQN